MSDKGSDLQKDIQDSAWTGEPCPHCGSSDIIAGFKLQAVRTEPVGLNYKAGRFFTESENLRAELCRTCGTVVRLYVNNAKRNWVVK